MSKLLLVIDDDPVERTILERVLAGAGNIRLPLKTSAELTDRA